MQFNVNFDELAITRQIIFSISCHSFYIFDDLYKISIQSLAVKNHWISYFFDQLVMEVRKAIKMDEILIEQKPSSISYIEADEQFRPQGG